MEMTTSEDNILPGKRPKRAWKLLPTGVTGRVGVQGVVMTRGCWRGWDNKMPSGRLWRT